MPQLAKLVTLTAFLVPGVIGRPAFSLTHQYCKLPLKEKDPIKSYSPITWTSREISCLAYHFGSSYATTVNFGEGKTLLVRPTLSLP